MALTLAARDERKIALRSERRRPPLREPFVEVSARFHHDFEGLGR